MIPRRAMLATKHQSLLLSSCVGKATVRPRQPQRLQKSRYATSGAKTTVPPSASSSQLLLLQRQTSSISTIRASISPLRLVTSSNTQASRYGFATTSTTTTSGKAKPTTKKADDGSQSGSLYFVKAGLPLLLFSLLGAWVVSNGIEGKNKERDAFQGRMSKSERQAHLDKEHDEMVDKLNYYVNRDFDNTKRIERPEEVLERRRKEREARNVWYKRWYRRFIKGE